MKALSIKQPYGGLIASGHKTIETRFWNTNHRGNVVFCVSKSDPMPCDRELPKDTDPGLFVAKGVTLCVAEIVDSRQSVEEDVEKAWCEITGLNYKGELKTKFSFILKNIRRVEQVPVRCSQRWFTVDDSLIKYID
jgi:hypothetical protein